MTLRYPKSVFVVLLLLVFAGFDWTVRHHWTWMSLVEGHGLRLSESGRRELYGSLMYASTRQMMDGIKACDAPGFFAGQLAYVKAAPGYASATGSGDDGWKWFRDAESPHLFMRELYWERCVAAPSQIPAVDPAQS